MDSLLSGLRAAGEPTRLRLLALCAHGELSVSELTQILGQSQPRVSRHLKLLEEAGLLERFREGALVFYRIAERSEPAVLARTLVDLLPSDSVELNRDLARLEDIRKKRVDAAKAYFKDNASQWNQIRRMHVAETEVEQHLLALIDQSTEMLALARTQLEQEGLKNVSVRKGDMYNMPMDDNCVDLATIHLVLHYAQEPHLVINEAARTLRKDGRLLIVDFAPHQEEHLRTEHNHQRLGFTDKEIRQRLSDAGLKPGKTHSLAGDPLTVKIWQATHPGAVH